MAVLMGTTPLMDELFAEFFRLCLQWVEDHATEALQGELPPVLAVFPTRQLSAVARRHLLSQAEDLQLEAAGRGLVVPLPLRRWAEELIRPVSATPAVAHADTYTMLCYQLHTYPARYHTLVVYSTKHDTLRRI